MTDFAPTCCPLARWLHRWAIVTLVLLFALLALGATVTSFRAGMADPDWPTRPWHLATVDWQESGRGYLIEHSHRLIGFITGGAVALLALGLWLTEPRPGLRWTGLAALAALLTAFGQLHATLIKHQRDSDAARTLLTPESWAIALTPTLIALLVVAALAVATVWRGGGLRLLGVVLLVGVMAQGILGGLRVYLNALIGTDLAVTHGVFSQIVLAVAVAVVVYSAPRRDVPADDRWHANPVLIRLGILAVVIVFGQIIAGAILRHTASTLGPRLHLLTAFLVVFAVMAVVRRAGADVPKSVRRLAVLAAGLVGVQILLGVEAWMLRFQSGFLLSEMQRITLGGAIVRSLHALIGYALFATIVALALTLIRNRATTPHWPTTGRRPVAELESVA